MKGRSVPEDQLLGGSVLHLQFAHPPASSQPHFLLPDILFLTAANHNILAFLLASSSLSRLKMVLPDVVSGKGEHDFVIVDPLMLHFFEQLAHCLSFVTLKIHNPFESSAIERP
jgi:hypothetical protein